MLHKYMFVYSTDSAKQVSECVVVYNRSVIKGNVMLDRNDIPYIQINDTGAVVDQAVSIFLNKHTNDKGLKVISVYELKEDENPSDMLWIPVKGLQDLCDPVEKKHKSKDDETDD